MCLLNTWLSDFQSQRKTKPHLASEAISLTSPAGFVAEFFRPQRKSLPFQQQQEKWVPLLLLSKVSYVKSSFWVLFLLLFLF